jgi:rhodanese-related sulfurtransferase
MFNIVKIEPSVNLPYDKLKDMSDEDVRQFIKKTNVDIPHIIYVSCRKGNDSKRAVDHLLKNGFNAVNIKGGIEEYGY